MQQLLYNELCGSEKKRKKTLVHMLLSFVWLGDRKVGGQNLIFPSMLDINKRG